MFAQSNADVDNIIWIYCTLCTILITTQKSKSQHKRNAFTLANKEDGKSYIYYNLKRLKSNTLYTKVM